MKLKYLVGIGMVCSMICSCSEEYMSFEGTDRIQFKTKTEEVYTFAYYPESIQKRYPANRADLGRRSNGLSPYRQVRTSHQRMEIYVR